MIKKENRFQEIFFSSWHPYFWIASAIFFVYFLTLFSGLVYLDDNVLVADNYFFNRDLSNFFQAFNEDIFRTPYGAGSFYRPILRLTFIFDAQFGQKAIIFMSHFSNVILHILSICLLFGLLKKFGIKKETALAFSLIFGIHPLTAQTVAFIPGRNDSLVAVFIFPALMFLLDYLNTWKHKHLFWHLAFFTLALFCKETAAVLPFVCTAYILIFISRKEIIANLKKYSYLLAGWGGVAALWFAARHSVLHNFIGNADYHLLPSIVKNSPALIPAIGKIILPFELSVFPILKDMTMVYGVLSLVILAIVFMLTRNKNYKLIGFGMFWFFLFIILTLIKPMDTVPDFSENRIYLPMFGFIFILLGFGQLRFTDFFGKKIRLAAILSLLVVLSIVTIYRNAYYKDKIHFWTNAVKTSPSFAFNHNNFGAIYYLDGNLELAEKEFKIALNLNPNERLAHNNLGLIYMNRGEFKKAEEEYDKELEINPYYDRAYANKAILYYKTEKFDKALDAWEKTLEVNPTYSEALYNLFAYYYQKQDKEKAFYWAKQTKDRGVPILPEMQNILDPLRGPLSLPLRK